MGSRGSIGEAVERVVDVGVSEVSCEERDAEDDDEVRICWRRVAAGWWCCC